MDKLRAIGLFVRLADLGSFTKVAEEVDASKSFISKEISRLEKEVGARLIHRSTRNIQLTDIGDGYLARCRELLIKMEDADSFVQDMQGAPRGKLKVNAPMALGVLDLGRAFADFMAVFPEIEVEMYLGDETMDLIEHGFDLGFRAASRQFDSPYIGRKLMTFSYRICASPEYLKNHPEINTPSDLEQHNCLIYTYFRGGEHWPVGDGVHVSGNLKVNSTIFMVECIKRGQGIGFIPDFVATEALANGDIVEILSSFTRADLTFYAMYPDRRFVPPKLTCCIQFLQKWFHENYVG